MSVEPVGRGRMAGGSGDSPELAGLPLCPGGPDVAGAGPDRACRSSSLP